MASKVEDKQGNYLVAFRWGGKQFTRSLDTKDPAIADAGVGRVEETVMRLKRGYLEMPADAEPGIFIVSGGRMTGKAVVESTTDAPAIPTLKSVFDHYTASLTPNAKEANSLETEQIHRRHLLGQLGEGTPFESIALATLQDYVNARGNAGRQANTIKKELATLRMVWNWAFKRGQVGLPVTWKVRDLTFSKSSQKESFKTWEEIEHRIEMGGLKPERVEALWECLYLDESQIKECLDWVKDHARHPFTYPMFVFCAYTGARRGEILRSERSDFNFSKQSVAIRQKKSDTSQNFTVRNVPLHPALIEVMKAWFKAHPGGRFTITSDGRDEELSPRMATKYFKQAVAGGKWQVLHGFHVFRHSLASIMASKGKDQRVINGILGHSTEDMERRYRHLFPKTQSQTMNDLFQ